MIHLLHEEWECVFVYVVVVRRGAWHTKEKSPLKQNQLRLETPLFSIQDPLSTGFHY